MNVKPCYYKGYYGQGKRPVEQSEQNRPCLMSFILHNDLLVCLKWSWLEGLDLGQLPAVRIQHVDGAGNTGVKRVYRAQNLKGKLGIGHGIAHK